MASVRPWASSYSHRSLKRQLARSAGPSSDLAPGRLARSSLGSQLEVHAQECPATVNSDRILRNSSSLWSFAHYSFAEPHTTSMFISQRLHHTEIPDAAGMQSS